MKIDNNSQMKPLEMGLQHAKNNSSKKLDGIYSVSVPDISQLLPPSNSENESGSKRRSRSVGSITGQDGKCAADKDKSGISDFTRQRLSIKEVQPSRQPGKNSTATANSDFSEDNTTSDTESFLGFDEMDEDDAFYAALTGSVNRIPSQHENRERETDAKKCELLRDKNRYDLLDNMCADALAEQYDPTQEEIAEMIASHNKLEQIKHDAALAQQLDMQSDGYQYCGQFFEDLVPVAQGL